MREIIDKEVVYACVVLKEVRRQLDFTCDYICHGYYRKLLWECARQIQLIQENQQSKHQDGNNIFLETGRGFPHLFMPFLYYGIVQVNI